MFLRQGQQMAVGISEGGGSLGPEQELRTQDMAEGGMAGPEPQTTSQETRLHGDSGSITSGCPHGAELVTFALKMVARKLMFKHKGTISSHLQVSPKGQVRAFFRLLESDLPQ